MLIEIMPPIEVYGTEYISVPIKYSDSYYRSSDLGDLIRFVALEDNTEYISFSKNGFPPTINLYINERE